MGPYAQADSAFSGMLSSQAEPASSRGSIVLCYRLT
jgi:hypothetical protein